MSILWHDRLKIRKRFEKVWSVLSDAAVKFDAFVFTFLTVLFLSCFSVMCNQRVPLLCETCSNSECAASSNPQAGSSTSQQRIKTQYELPVSISDHTGTIENCRLTEKCAEGMFGCKVSSNLWSWHVLFVSFSTCFEPSGTFSAAERDRNFLLFSENLGKKTWYLQASKWFQKPTKNKI